MTAITDEGNIVEGYVRF